MLEETPLSPIEGESPTLSREDDLATKFVALDEVVVFNLPDGDLTLSHRNPDWQRRLTIKDEGQEDVFKDFFHLFKGTLGGQEVFIEVVDAQYTFDAEIMSQLPQIIKQLGGRGIETSGRYFIIHSAQPQSTEISLDYGD
ncbi:hypothetical protein KJ707_03335 [Patescibacteria group bacterium]|nr:hypothetical protein [Patescibacteria group bacterium]